MLTLNCVGQRLSESGLNVAMPVYFVLKGKKMFRDEVFELVSISSKEEASAQYNSIQQALSIDCRNTLRLSLNSCNVSGPEAEALVEPAHAFVAKA